jgi:aminoglycoside phosphotransferase (APT) family kinase protein
VTIPTPPPEEAAGSRSNAHGYHDLSGAPGIELGAVADWMSAHGLGSGPLQNVSPIAGGTQNLLWRFDRSDRRYVLRRGPAHLRPASNQVMVREARVLAALADTDVPHPRLIAVCTDTQVFGGAVFYLMDLVDGFTAGAGARLPALHEQDPAMRHSMGMAMVDALVRLGDLDYRAVGLAGFGKPDGFLPRQVPRWLSELESYSALPGYRGADIGDVSGVAQWLREHQPTHWTPGIMHGDYHAANVMFSSTGPGVTAILDWEMCTIGDPMLDLGWMIATVAAEAGNVMGHALTDRRSTPKAEEIVDRYSRQSSRDVTHAFWYAVLACFKLGIILEGTHARAEAGRAPRETGERLHAVSRKLFARASELMG